MLAALYPWIKSLHIVSIVAWMAGLLYLPRLYVYHADVPAGSNRARLFEIMERRLLRGIMLPSVVGAYLFGGMLAGTPEIVDWGQGWIWVKLALVGFLTLYHVLLARWRRDFAASRYPHTARFFRAINELPAVALLVIVILVVVRPF